MATSVPDEWLEGDFEAFEECMADATAEMDGYWSPFAVLAWIASSGDVSFLAGVQAFEKRNHANMGKPHSWPTWLVVSNWAGRAYDVTFSDASERLRQAMAANRISGSIATNERSGELVHLERAMWTRWEIAHHNWGLSFLPGFVDFKWPAEAVLAAFPRSQEDQPAMPQRVLTKADAEKWYQDRVSTWSGKAPSRDDDVRAGRLVGLKSERVRELRNLFAPDHWKSSGRPIGS